MISPSAGLFLQVKIEPVVSALNLRREGGLGVVDGRNDLLHVVGDETGFGGCRVPAGLPVPDDGDAVPAELRTLGSRQRVFALFDGALDGGTACWFALGQEENAAAVDRLSLEGYAARDSGALACAAAEQTGHEKGENREKVTRWCHRTDQPS